MVEVQKRILQFLLFKSKDLVAQDETLSLRAKTNPSMLENLEKGVASALESVIPEAALHPFLLLNDTEKVTQLNELSNLVLGIRLFNKEINSRKDLLHSSDYLLSQLDDNFRDQVQEHITNVIQIIEDYQGYLEYAEKNEIEEESKTAYTQELIFLRQYLNYLMSLFEKIETSFNIMESTARRYAKEIMELKHFLGSKTSAPKDQVYPKFAVAATSYITLNDESRKSQQKKESFELFVSFFEKFAPSITEAHVETSRRFFEEKEENQERQENVEPKEFQSKNNVVFIPSKHSQEFLDISLDLMGYCLVTLVENDGLLIAGKHSLGVLNYKDRSLVFRSEKEIEKFLERPEEYTKKLYQICRRIPPLILFLNEEPYFAELGINLVKFDEVSGTASKVMVDREVETPVHIVEKFIDKDYCWDEWELRKKAIQMANIRNMTTKASQTDDSVFKVENQTQVWLHKEAATMTGINNGNNPIRPRNYITDLRDKSVQ